MKYFISYYWWDERWSNSGISNYVITLDENTQIKDQIDIDKIEKILSDRKANVRCKIINSYKMKSMKELDYLRSRISELKKRRNQVVMNIRSRSKN